jgi:hypothetical protein
VVNIISYRVNTDPDAIDSLQRVIALKELMPLFAKKVKNTENIRNYARVSRQVFQQGQI